MKYTFKADSIELGTDDTEEAYSIMFTETSPDGGPPLNYLLLQRSVGGIDEGEPEFAEPYVEFNDASNGRFATSFVQATLTETSFALEIRSGAGIVRHPGVDPLSDEIRTITVHFDADAAKLRKLRYALSLVIGDGFTFDADGAH